MTFSRARRVLWAVNPFELTSRQRQQAERILRLLQSSHPIAIELLFVLTPAELNLSEEYPGWLNELVPTARKALERVAASLPGDWKVEAKVLRRSSATSLHQAVLSIADYALAGGYDLILSGTHARRGWSRFFLGSFAEQLLAESRVPVLVMPPGMQREEGGPAPVIVHPTDFGPGSKRTFIEVVDMAAAFGARVALFHAIPHPIQPILQSGAYLLGGGWLPPPSFYDAEAERPVRRAEAWARWAKGRGVEVRTRVDLLGESIPDTIVQWAWRERAILIAMESHSGRVASALIGSIARQVIRNAPCAVLAFHPQRGKTKVRDETLRRAA